MNRKQKLEQIYDTLSSTEIMLIMSTSCLLLTSHSKSFVEAQKELLKKMEVRQEVKDICNDIFDEIKITEEN